MTRSIDVTALHADPRLTVVDVREPDEFAAGHVPGALSLPMSQLNDRLGEWPDGPVAVICQVGGRSARVVDALASRDYDVVNVDGGTSAWDAAGFPLDR